MIKYRNGLFFFVALMVVGIVVAPGLSAAASDSRLNPQNKFTTGYNPGGPITNHNRASFKTPTGLIETTSGNWAGYAIETNLGNPSTGVVTAASASWAVPAVNPSATNAYSSFWVGIDGYTGPGHGTLEQIGTISISTPNQAIYYAWYEFVPNSAVTITTITLRAGDVVSASVTYSAGSFTLSITQQRTGTHFSITQPWAGATETSAEWIAEAPTGPNGQLPLANFGTVTFTNAQATISGTTGSINAANWQYDAIVMVPNVAVNAQPSSLSSDGKSFSVSAFPTINLLVNPTSGTVSHGGTILATVSTSSAVSLSISAGGVSGSTLWYYRFQQSGTQFNFWSSTYYGIHYSGPGGITYTLLATANFVNPSGHGATFQVVRTSQTLLANDYWGIAITGTTGTSTPTITYILTVSLN